MNRTALAWTCAIAAVLSLLCIPLLDRTVAEAVHAAHGEQSWLLSQATALLDLIVGRKLAKFLLGGLLLGIGIICLGLPRMRRAAWPLIFIGLCDSLTLAVTGAIKFTLGRERPYQIFAHNDWYAIWFAGGDSYPSGHVAFYFGLFFPMLYLFPKAGWLLLPLPLFIAVARVGVSDHFPSDVLASIALAAGATLAVIWLLEQSTTRAKHLLAASK